MQLCTSAAFSDEARDGLPPDDEAPESHEAAVLVAATGSPTTSDDTALRSLLRNFEVEIEELEALDMWAVRGEASVIAALREPASPLGATEDFEVLPDGEMHEG